MTVQELPVRTRIEYPTNTYFFHHQNDEALRKPSVPFALIPVPTEVLVFIGVLAVIIVMFVGLGFSVLPDWALIVGASGGIVLGAIPFWNASQRNTNLNKRITREGTFLQGTIESCIGKMGYGQRPSFSVTTKYLFRTPKGTLIRRTTTQNRPDLNGTQLPIPGTPVMVLYFTDHEYYLL